MREKSGDAWVVFAFAGDFGEVACEMDLAAVFEVMDQFFGLVRGKERGACEVKLVVELAAVWTGEDAFDGTVEGFTAVLAKGGMNAREFF